MLDKIKTWMYLMYYSYCKMLDKTSHDLYMAGICGNLVEDGESFEDWKSRKI